MSTSSDRKQGGHKLFDAWGRNLAIMSPSSTSGPAWGKYQLPTNYLSFGESWLPWELIARQWSRRVNKEQGGRLYNNNNNNNNIARSQLVEVDARNQNEQWSYLGRCTHPPHTDRWPVSDLHWWCIYWFAGKVAIRWCQLIFCRMVPHRVTVREHWTSLLV